MTTLSSCSSGIGASIVLLAFIFDLIFFFIAKSRISAVGGSAELGTGLWLTLASWVMLFFSGCFYGFGRCCIAKRSRGPRGTKNDKSGNVEQGVNHTVGGGMSNTEAMRMEAIKAENERKARQAEQGLPAFPTQAEAVPLRKNSSPQYYYETDSEDEHQTQRSRRDDYRSVSTGPRRQETGYSARRQGSGDTNITSNYAGRGRLPSNPGYIPASPGRNPVDPYNNSYQISSASNVPPSFPSSTPLPNVYPPQTHYTQPSTAYSVSTSPPPMPVGATQQPRYLSPSNTGSGVGQVYGHGPQESSCELLTSLPDWPRFLYDFTSRPLCVLKPTWVHLRRLRFHKPLRRSGRGQTTGRLIILLCSEYTQHAYADTTTTYAFCIPK